MWCCVCCVLSVSFSFQISSTFVWHPTSIDLFRSMHVLFLLSCAAKPADQVRLVKQTITSLKVTILTCPTQNRKGCFGTVPIPCTNFHIPCTVCLLKYVGPTFSMIWSIPLIDCASCCFLPGTDAQKTYDAHAGAVMEGCSERCDRVLNLPRASKFENNALSEHIFALQKYPNILTHILDVHCHIARYRRI